ncbi:hypothetical protein ACE1BM_22960, partial [Aeromonas jandaei]
IKNDNNLEKRRYYMIGMNVIERSPCVGIRTNLVTMPLPLPESLYQQLEPTFIMLWHKRHKRHNQDARMRWLLDEIKRGCRVGSKVPPVSMQGGVHPINAPVTAREYPSM